MKTLLSILLYTCAVFCCAAQNRALRLVDSCLTVLERRVADHNTAFPDAKLELDRKSSYVSFDSGDGTAPKKRSLSDFLEHTETTVSPEATFSFGFVYCVVYDTICIHSYVFRCDSDLANSTADFRPYLRKLKKGTLIRPAKVAEIANKEGISPNATLNLDEDPAWKGPEHYESNEKKWKLTWTVRSKRSTDGSIPGYDVLKLDAKSGRVLSRFVEFPID